MGKLTFILISITILVAGISILPVVLFYNIWSDSEPSELPEHLWGQKLKEGEPEDKTIRQIDITVSEAMLSDLQSRLRLETSVEGNRLKPPLEGIEFQYGFNTQFLANLSRYWLTDYDWKIREKLLNKYPQFLTTIAGIEIHFQHIKPPLTATPTTTRPLLLLHGWPGSYIEFQKVIPLLTDPENMNMNFELIIPSLPGFGFSEMTDKPGLGPAQIGQIFLKLMRRLGHEKFYIQGGGDFGSWVGSNMATLYPYNVMGIHMNPCVSFHSRSQVRLILMTSFSIYGPEFENIWDSFSTIVEESGSLHHQATKPDTISVALSNSPTGLAAYILEKFSTWTNIKWRGLSNGGLVPYFNIDELLDNVMIYWVTNSITSSMRLYAEAFSRKQRNLNLDNAPVKVPTGCLQSPHGIFGWQDEWLLQDKFPQIVHFTKAEKGGHFTAFEFPKVFAEDVFKFFNFLEASYSNYDDRVEE